MAQYLNFEPSYPQTALWAKILPMMNETQITWLQIQSVRLSNIQPTNQPTTVGTSVIYLGHSGAFLF